MNHCWYKTKIDIKNAISPVWNEPVISNANTDGVFSFKKTMLSASWIEYMENLGLFVQGVMVFLRPPYIWDIHAHADGTSLERIRVIALNWILRGKGSEMVWYNLPETLENPCWQTSANTPFLAWSRNNLVEIDRCEILSDPILTRVNVPHAINVSGEERLSISVRFENKDRFDWNQTVELFAEKNLIYSRR